MDTETKMVNQIKEIGKIFWADRDAREKAAEKVATPFKATLIYHDGNVVAEIRAQYKEALAGLDMCGGDERDSELGRHYQKMIELLS